MTRKQLERQIKRREAQAIRSQRAIDRALSAISKSYSRAVKALMATLEVNDEGDIKNSAKNITVIRRIERLHKELMKEEGAIFAKTVSDEINKVEARNFDYFDRVHEGDTERYRSGVRSTLNRTLGIDGGGSSGILGNLEAIGVHKKIQQVVLTSVVSGITITAINNVVDNFIRGKGRRGELEKAITSSIDLDISQWDRIINKDYSKRIGFEWALYSGDLIPSSRPFCIERAGKVFHISEIRKFGTPQDEYGGYTNKSQGQFAGKPAVYNPEIHLGGYECRHVLSWISKELADLYRSDVSDFD